MRRQLRPDEEDARREFEAVEPGDFPGGLAGGELLVVGALGLEHETAAPGSLRDRRDGGRCSRPGPRAVPARRELDLIGGIGPVLDVGAVRPACDPMPVEEQLETLVGADVHAQRRGGRL